MHFIVKFILDAFVLYDVACVCILVVILQDYIIGIFNLGVIGC